MRHLLSTALVIALAAACSPQEVVLADLPASDGGTPSSSACTDDGNCPSSQFCARTSCGDATGRCEVAPIACDDVRSPSCGCDGVTYWNDCLRRANRVRAATPGECGVATSCGGREKRECPSGASCARIYPHDRCDLDERGVCWVLPPVCPPDSNGPKYTVCGPPGPPPGPPPECLDLCNAIRTQRSLQPLPPDTKCPPPH